MDSEFGDILRALRLQAGLSLQAVSRKIHWSKAAIGHAETGARPPSPDLAAALDRELGANGLLIVLAAAERGCRRTVNDMDRRGLIKALVAGGLSSLTPPILEPSLEGRRIGSTDIVALVGRIAQLRHLDNSLGGADTFTLYMAEVESTEALLATSTYSGGTRRALLSVLSEQTQLAGWAAFDAGWINRSTGLYRKSYAAAVEADDPALLANALALKAYQKAFTGRPDADLAHASIEALDDRVPVRVHALIHDRASWSFALAGRPTQAEFSLDAATRALSVADAAEPPHWASWVDTQELEIMTGRCWAALRRPLRAVPPLESALRAFPNAYARDKAIYLLALAAAYLHGHELELAAASIKQAHRLTKDVASTRPTIRLRQTLSLMSETTTTGAARDLQAELDASR
ncbi:helix-turn-helix transcriptional regulator [Krasilnikovia sp. M28-CT-15]|uniref:helix-turn-helix transcriptional regulator n=1 Tax=Krasilnikovia sp. M28-CT-15 TaxID=3373540 RepID=UPI0038772986